MAARNIRFSLVFMSVQNWQKKPGYDDAIYLLSPLTSVLPIF